MNDVEKLPYAGWLEDGIRLLTEHDVKSIAIAALTGGEQVLTAYWEAGMADKAVMAAFIQGDAMLDMAMANAKMIVEAAEEEEEDGT